MSPWLHLAAGLLIWWAVLRLCGFWAWADSACWRLEFEWYVRPALDRSRLVADLASFKNPQGTDHEAMVDGFRMEVANYLRQNPGSASWLLAPVKPKDPP